MSVISKILEKVVANRLPAHIKNSHLSNPLQSAYRKHHSTESALLKVHNDIIISMDQSEVTALTLLDLSAAFDTIYHATLRNRLSDWYGISGQVQIWFYSYLQNRHQLVQLSNGIFLLKRVSRYGRCFMIDSGSKGCPEQESAGCHFGTLGRNFLRAKTKWPPNISRSNMIFQQIKPGTSVIPHFYVILTGQYISCIILMTQGYLRGQKDNFKVKEAKIQFSTNKDRNMCNTSFTWDFI